MSANATRQVRQVRTLQSSIVVAESVCATVKNNIHTESDVQTTSVHVIVLYFYSSVFICTNIKIAFSSFLSNLTISSVNGEKNVD